MNGNAEPDASVGAGPKAMHGCNHGEQIAGPAVPGTASRDGRETAIDGAETASGDDRAALAARYARLLARIEIACRQAGRAPESVRLLAVSKTFGVEQIEALHALGQEAFGENYLQEALHKIEACRANRGPTGPEWHFIGPIQSNKTRPISAHFDWVHSVDRQKIATRLGEQRPAGLPPLQCCVQVNVSGEASKSGCAPAEALDIARAIAAQPLLRLRGVMAIPEPTDDEALQRRRFAAARGVLEEIRERIGREQPEAAARIDTLSMGMSGDLEAAIAEGATIVRVGTALFGARANNGARANKAFQAV
jgi:pyridoxal phosphate enzyme (YggS family)